MLTRQGVPGNLFFMGLRHFATGRSGDNSPSSKTFHVAEWLKAAGS